MPASAFLQRAWPAGRHTAGVPERGFSRWLGVPSNSRRGRAHSREAASLEQARLGSRSVWFEGGWRDTSIWSRLDLPAGATIEGPAILEQSDATTVIEPGLVGLIDAIGNLVVEPAR